MRETVRAKWPDHLFGQHVLNRTGVYERKRELDPPVPVVARIVWEWDDEEHIHTVAVAKTRREVCVKLPDLRYQFDVIWLDASDVKPRSRVVRPARREVSLLRTGGAHRGAWARWRGHSERNRKWPLTLRFRWSQAV
jgi:hypothetical protein